MLWFGCDFQGFMVYCVAILLMLLLDYQFWAVGFSCACCFSDFGVLEFLVLSLVCFGISDFLVINFGFPRFSGFSACNLCLRVCWVGVIQKLGVFGFRVLWGWTAMFVCFGVWV